MRLPLKRPAVDIINGLPRVCVDRTILAPPNPRWLDARAGHGPLAQSNRRAPPLAMDVGTIQICANQGLATQTKATEPIRGQ